LLGRAPVFAAAGRHRSVHTMSSHVQALLTKRKRTSRQRIPFSIPLDHALARIDWSRILSSLQDTNEQKSSRRKVKAEAGAAPTELPPDVAVAAEELGADLVGQPASRNPLQLRRICTAIKFRDASGEALGKLDFLTRQVRAFLTSSSQSEIARWWKRLHGLLPEPIFFLLYTTLRAVA
jgi:hypothetical protein